MIPTDMTLRMLLVCCAIAALPGEDALAQRAPSSTIACVSAQQSPAGNNFKSVAFDEFAVTTHSDALPEGGPSGVLGLRSVSVNRRGQILVVDSRMRRVTLRSPSLQTLTTVGREGEGPGEYRQPVFAMFGLDDRIWLVDAVLGRISIYDASGKFVRALPRPFLNARELIAVADTTVLVMGAVPLGEAFAIATLVSETGRTIWQGVPADSLLRATKLILDGVWGARSPDGTAVVGLAVSPGVSRIDVGSGKVLCTSRVPAVAWTQLDAAKRPASGLGPTRQWIEQASSVQRTQSTADGRVVIATSPPDKGDGKNSEWIVFGGGLNPMLRVRDVPGRLLLIRSDTAWIAAESEDGRQQLVRAVLRPNSLGSGAREQ